MEGMPPPLPPPAYDEGDKPPPYSPAGDNRPVFSDSNDNLHVDNRPVFISSDDDNNPPIDKEEPALGENSRSASDDSEFCPDEFQPDESVESNEGGKDLPTITLIWNKRPLGMALLSHRPEDDTGAVVKQVYIRKDGLVQGLIFHKINGTVVDNLKFPLVAQMISKAELPIEVVFHAQPMKIIDPNYNYKRGGERDSSQCLIL